MKFQSNLSSNRSATDRLAPAIMLVATFVAAAASQASRAQDPVAAPAAIPAPKESVTEALIRLLAEHNAISKTDAEGLIQRLQAEQAVQEAPKAAAPASAASGTPAIKEGTVRVFHVPESEKKRIREELKHEVIKQAKAENWAQPNALPEWTQRVVLSGDVRVRQENDYFDDNNNVPFLNFQALNAGAPFNINPGAAPLSLPFINTTEARRLQRVRARLGVVAKVSDELTAGFRFASGSASNPVSTNQTFGPDFNKLNLLIDRAYLDFHPMEGAHFLVGRMPNPLISTELVLDEDLNLDGFALQYRRDLGNDVTPFGTLGFFSVANTSFDFPGNFAIKQRSRDKSLLAAQIGAAWRVGPDLSARGAIAYYDWNRLAGVASSPCVALSSGDSCDTDNSRPGFVQKGNTLFAIRTLSQLDGNPNAPEFQYFGLASDFGVFNVNVELDWVIDGPLHALLVADYAYNLDYDSGDMLDKVPVNNYDSCDQAANPGCSGPFSSGSKAYFAQLLVGYPKVTQRWQWHIAGGYRRIDADAVPDGFNDSDFHLGGTNARGYHVQGALGFTHNGWVSLRWLSSSEESGAPLSIDTVYLDLNARF